MTRTARLLLSGVALVAMAQPVLAEGFYFRMVRPGSEAPKGTDGTQPPGAGTNNPPAAGTNDEPSTGTPVLRLTGVDATSTQGGGVPIDARFVLENAVGQVTYEVVSGSPPPELRVAQDGTFTGTPRTGGRYVFVVRATDSTPSVSEMSVDMSVVPEIPQITVHMPDGPIFAGTRFSAPISVDNGVEIKDFTFGETPPSFLTILGNEMRGAPGTGDAGYQFYVVQGNDNYGQSGMSFGSFEVLVPSLSISGLPSRTRSAAALAATLDTNLPDGTWTFTSSPAGIPGSIDGTTLTATTPTVATETPFSLSVSRTRQDGVTASATSGLVAVPPLAVSGGGAVVARVGRALTSVPTPTASNLLDVARGASWDLAAGTLPSGLAIDPAAGSVSGTPAAGTQGDYPGVAARATDPTDNATATGAPFPVRVLGALAFQGVADTVTLTRGSAYSASPSFANNVGSGPVTASNLPADLALTPGSATPTLSGSPSANGTSVSRFAVTDPADGASAVYDVTFQVVDPVTASTSTTTARQTSTVAYNPTLSGQAPFTTSLTSGSLPAGLSADPATLRITGTPQQVGSYTATYRVTDARGATGSVPISVTVTAAPTASAGPGLRFRSQRTRTVANGVTTSGVATAAWSKSGAWPAWLSIDPTSGDVTGSPTSVTTATVSALVTDQVDGANATAPISVSTIGDLAATAPGALTAREQVAVPSTAPAPSASNLLGTAQATWALASGSLANGLSIDATKGTIVGTPATGTAGDYSPALTATDPTDGATATTAQYAVRVIGPLAFQGIPSSVTLTRGRSFSASPSFRNNLGGGAVTASNLPADLALTSDGPTPTLSGSPSANGTRVSRFAVTDPTDGASAAYDVTFNVVDPVTASSSSTTARRTSAVSYTPTLTGTAPYAIRFVSGSLPANLSADLSTLTVSGSPTSEGTSTATYEVTDANGAVGTVPVTVTVTPAPTAADGPVLKFRQDRSRYIASGIVPSGMTSPTWSMSGTWPSWLTLDSTNGFVEGVPGVDAVGTSATVMARITDGVDKAYATASVPLTVYGPLTSSYPGTAYVREGVPVPATIAAPTVANVMGPAPATWSGVAGALPGGLGVNEADGRFVGTPAAGTAGGYQIRLAAKDPTDGAYGNTPFLTLRVLGAMAFQGVADNVRLTRGYAYSASPAFTNNVGGGALAASGLPSGIAFQQSGGTGTLSGAPQAVGTYVATFSVVDPIDGAQATRNVAYTVVDALVAAQPATTMRVTQTKPYDPGLSGQGPFTWTLSSGSIPPGLQADPATLVMTGSPTTAGSYTATYAVTDATGAQGAVTLSFTVNPAPTLTASKAFTVRVNRGRTGPSGLVANGIAQPQWSNTTSSDWFSIDPGTGDVTATPVYTPPPGGAARLMIQDVETTGSTTTQVSPGTINRFTVKVVDLTDGALATVSYMVKAYGDIAGAPSASAGSCYSLLVDNARTYNPGSSCKMTYSGVMSTAPTNDFNTIVPAMTVLTTSASALPSQVTVNPYAQITIPAGLTFEWDGAFRFTDPIDGQQFTTAAYKVSSAPSFVVPTDYRDASTSNTSSGYFVNGEPFRIVLQGTVTGGTAPYAYALTANGSNNSYGIAAGASLNPPPYGAFDASAGIWSGTALAASGQVTGNMTASLRVSDSRGRYVDRAFQMIIQERTAGYVCTQFSGSNTKRQAVLSDSVGIKADNFRLSATNVIGTGKTGNGVFRLVSYPGIDGNGVPTGTPTVAATYNYSNTGSNQTYKLVGNSSARMTSKVWAIEAIPQSGNTDPVPTFTAIMSDQNGSPSTCAY